MFAASLVGLAAAIVLAVLWLRRPNPATADPLAYRWTDLPEPAFPIPPGAEYLRGVRVVLDPGHGGTRPGDNAGPTGLREAEINLAVARRLAEFLSSVGAIATLTRNGDVFLDRDVGRDLAARVAIGRTARADLFLSIHHNASENPTVNYPAVFYHGAPEDNPASLSAARELVGALSDALRLPDHLSCPVVSDTEITPTGYAVLREAEVPAVLVEASFHTNPDEERQLRDPVYNRREAYGLFLGLARWAYGGLPRVSCVTPRDCVLGGVTASVTLFLDDGLRARGEFGTQTPKVRADTIRATLAGSLLVTRFDPESSLLVVDLPPSLPDGDVDLRVVFENIFGQAVLHPVLTLRRVWVPAADNPRF